MGDFINEENGRKYKEENYQKQFESPDASILVVDDVDMNLVVIKCLLKETKIQIDIAKSGKECLQKVREKK